MPLLETDLGTAIGAAKKALVWLRMTADVDQAARRAFVLCDGIMRRIAPGLRVDLRDWPDGGEFGGVESKGNGNGGGNGSGDGNGNGHDSGSGMEAFELVDFEGGVF